jgi:cystathionine beta-lyase/cystathionine gamma-synthase
MVAISAALLSVLSAGDYLLLQSNVYGGTHSFVTHDCQRLGIEISFVDGLDPRSWETALRPNTRAIYVESVSNPLMDVPALDAVPAFARRHGLTSIIDNTFMSPVNLRPAELGFDVILHSATKYLNGHSDITAGVIAGRESLVQGCHEVLNHLGGSLDPHACFLLERGLRTLALRVARQNQTALKLARSLEAHPAVTRVRYPGLPSHPSHDIASRHFAGFGGMLSFETQTLSVADRFLAEVRIPVHAASLGGVETLVVKPAASTHLGMAPEERQALGITDRLIRLSVGIEDPDELWDDILRALDTAMAT